MLTGLGRERLWRCIHEHVVSEAGFGHVVDVESRPGHGLERGLCDGQRARVPDLELEGNPGLHVVDGHVADVTGLQGEQGRGPEDKFHVQGREAYFPIGFLTIIVPRNPWIVEFYVAQKHRSTDFVALKL